MGTKVFTDFKSAKEYANKISNESGVSSTYHRCSDGWEVESKSIKDSASDTELEIPTIADHKEVTSLILSEPEPEPDSSNLDVVSLLEKANEAEKELLTSLLELEHNADEKQIMNEAGLAGGHSVANYLRDGGVSYWEIVQDVAEEVGLENTDDYIKDIKLDYVVLEQKILLHLFQKIWDGMSEEEQKEFGQKMNEFIEENYGESYGVLGTTAGAIFVGGAAGFAPYLMATSLLSSFSGALGLTLSFSAYTGLTSLLSTAFGPVGWSVLAGVLVYKTGSTNFKKTIPFVIAISGLRDRLNRGEV